MSPYRENARPLVKRVPKTRFWRLVWAQLTRGVLSRIYLSRARKQLIADLMREAHVEYFMLMQEYKKIGRR